MISRFDIQENKSGEMRVDIQPFRTQSKSMKQVLVLLGRERSGHWVSGCLRSCQS